MAKIKLIRIHTLGNVTGQEMGFVLKSSEHFEGSGTFSQAELEEVATQLYGSQAGVTYREYGKDAVITHVISNAHIIYFRIIEEVDENGR